MFVFTPSHRFPAAGRLMAASVWMWGVASAALAAVGWSTDRPADWPLVLGIGVLSLGVSLVSAVPLRLVQAGGAGVIPMAVLAATAVRLCLTVILVVVLCEMQMAPRQMIGLWAILWYALMMTAELSSVIRYSAGASRQERLPAGEPKVQ